MRVTSRGEALFMAVFLIIIGLSACLTGRLAASSTSKPGIFPVEGPAISIAGAVLVITGLWVIFSIVKDKFFH